MKILITGANGYIGSRLILVLLKKNHELFALVRDPRSLNIPFDLKRKIKIIVGDLNHFESLANIPPEIEIAYFLVHSLRIPNEKFQLMEKQMVNNFLKVVSKTNIKQIIYLSGLVSKKRTSKHLKSRYNIEKILMRSKIPATVLRSSVIIGSGSISFEIMRDLVEKIPIMIAPRWVLSKSQPISIYDVLDYLILVINDHRCFKRSFDIGGPDILTYKEMLLRLAKKRGLNRKIITVPFLTLRLSSYWLYFVTLTNLAIAKWLIDSLITDSICKETEIQKIFPKKCIDFETALKKSFIQIEENPLISTSFDSLIFNLPKSLSAHIQAPKFGCLTNIRTEKFFKNPKILQEVIWKIDDNHGWHIMNFLWKIRNLINKLFGKVYLSHGKKKTTNLRSGDTIDFWRVLLADKENKRLLLYAKMKLPGEAWLEFKIIPHMNHCELCQTATFRPLGISGRLYWYLTMPFHLFFFRKMCKEIIKSANSK